MGVGNRKVKVTQETIKGGEGARCGKHEAPLTTRKMGVRWAARLCFISPEGEKDAAGSLPRQ